MTTKRAVPWRTCVASAAVALGGCMNMSGLSGTSSYGCKAPEGVTCDSVSGTYANAIQNNLPSQRPRPAAPASAEGAALPAAGEPPLSAAPATTIAASALPMPLRSSARILRLWFKPWEDADRDLYDQGYVYVQIDGGQWLIEHAQRQIREAYAPLRPPPRGAAPSHEPKDGAVAPPWPKGPPQLPLAENPLSGVLPSANRLDATD